MPENTTGILIIDKPDGPTSHDVVARVRKLTQLKTGHSGTLDPFATGVLLVAIGSATRLLEYTRDLPKTYLATITLGATSDTDDRTGIITPKGGVGVASREQIHKVITQFLGPIQQIPPQYSAVKVAGKRSYAQARTGETVALKPRPVTIHSIKLLAYEYPTLKLEIVCGGGTYIRALARDLGATLGTGAYVQELRRVAIGPFDIKHSVAFDELSTGLRQSYALQGTPYLLPPEVLVNHLPKITLDPANVAKFKLGQSVALTEAQPRGERSKLYGDSAPIAIFDESNSLISIGKFDPITSLLHPSKNL